MIVKSVSLPIVDDPFKISKEGKLRSFQKDFIDCIENREMDIIQLVAPTGAGKTLCFEYLFNKGYKVLLLYPTNALIKNQIDRFENLGFTVAHISGKILEKKGYERSRELMGLITRYDIILTNPDIFQAIIGHMYKNPEEDLIRTFSFFQYVVYDEFHAYREFELSGILTQIALFQNMSRCRIILSSATPKSEILKLLESIRIGKNRTAPLIEISEAKKCISGEGAIIRHDTQVEFKQGKILDYFDDIIGILKDSITKLQTGEPQILVIFDSVKDCNEFFWRLHDENRQLYDFVEKDNGYDTNQVGDTPDFTKPILISTNKSEIGLDYPIELLIMEDGFNFDSFVQRFGRAGRHGHAECYIFTKKEVNPRFTSDAIEYEDFISEIKNITDEYSIKIDKVKILFTFRQALAIQEYSYYKQDLKEYFSVDSGLSYKAWCYFLSIMAERKKNGLVDNDFNCLCLLIDDFKAACKSLRGRSLRRRIKYQRGHELRQTIYDVLTVINQNPVNVKIMEEEIIIEEIKCSDRGPYIQAIKLPYIKGPINYQKRREQIRDQILEITYRTKSGFPSKNRDFFVECIKKLIYSVDMNIDKIVLPDEIFLWNNKIIPLSKDAMEFHDD